MTWESRPGRRRAGSRDWWRARWRDGGRVGSDSRALTMQKREACSFSIYIRHLLSPSLCPAFSSSPPPYLPTSCRFVAPTTRTPSCPAATSTPSSSFRKVERTYKEQGGNKKGRGVVQEGGREQEIRAEECEDQAGKKRRRKSDESSNEEDKRECSREGRGGGNETHIARQAVSVSTKGVVGGNEGHPPKKIKDREEKKEESMNRRRKPKKVLGKSGQAKERLE